VVTVERVEESLRLCVLCDLCGSRFGLAWAWRGERNAGLSSVTI